MSWGRYTLVILVAVLACVLIRYTDLMLPERSLVMCNLTVVGNCISSPICIPADTVKRPFNGGAA